MDLYFNEGVVVDSDLARSALRKQVFLDLPLIALFLPEHEPVGRYGRLVHELLLEKAPWRIAALAEADQLLSFIISEQDRLSARAKALGMSWQKNNPPPSSTNYFDRVAWHNHAKAYARELIERELFDAFDG
jgi:hypothetical protein